jgi:hypothetical protein
VLVRLEKYELLADRCLSGRDFVCRNADVYVTAKVAAQQDSQAVNWPALIENFPRQLSGSRHSGRAKVAGRDDGGNDDSKLLPETTSNARHTGLHQFPIHFMGRVR